MNVQRSSAIRAQLAGERRPRRLVAALSLVLGTGVMVASHPGPGDPLVGTGAAPTDGTTVAATALEQGATLVPAIPVGTASADLDSLRMDLRNAVGAAVWLARSGDSWQVHAAERLAPREWGEDVALSVPGMPTEAPVVDVYPDEPEWSRHNELVLVAWRAFDGQYWRVQVSLKRAGSPWTTPRTVSVAGVDAGKPVASIVEWGDGTLEPRVVWRRFDASNSRLQIVRLHPDGTVRRPPRYFTPAGSWVRDPAIDSDGDEVIWTQFDGRNWRLVADSMAFLQGSEEHYTLSPPGEDVLEPSTRVGMDETAYTWLTGEGEQARVRVLAGGSAGPSIGTGGSTTRSATLSPIGLPAQAPRVQLQSAGPPYYREYPVVFWRQFDGSHWRIATRSKPPGERWQPLEYLSSPGVDASLLVSDSDPSYPYGPAASAAWLESTDPPALRAITLLPGPARKVSTLLEDATGVGDLTVDHANTLGPGFGWVASGPAGDQVTVRGLDVLAPSPRLAELPTWTPRRTRTVRWDAADDWSPVSGYTVSWTRHKWSTGTADSKNWLTGSVATRASHHLAAGYTYCYTVRATDAVRHVSGVSWKTCTTTPVDDRALKRSGAWRLGTGPAWYRGTYLAARRQGASLTLPAVSGKRVYAVLLATGPGYGKVRIQAGDYVRTVNLDTTVQRHRVIEQLSGSASPCLDKPLTITVISTGRPVRVDGAFARAGNLGGCGIESS